MDVLSDDFKNLLRYQSKMKPLVLGNCPWRLWKTYIYQVTFIQVFIMIVLDFATSFYNHHKEYQLKTILATDLLIALRMLFFLRYIFIACNYTKNKQKNYMCNNVNIYIYIWLLQIILKWMWGEYQSVQSGISTCEDDFWSGYKN